MISIRFGSSAQCAAWPAAGNLGQLCVLVLAIMAGVAAQAQEPADVTEEFLEIARELRDGDYQLADMHAKALEQKLKDPDLAPIEQIDTRLQLMHQRMVHGYTADAVVQAENVLWLLQLAIEAGAQWHQQWDFVLKPRGTAYMRLAEQVRCAVQRGPENCTFAPKNPRSDQYEEYTEVAFASLLRYLEHYPNDGEARWLVNVLAGTLGRHPEAVPAALRIDMFAPSPDASVVPFPDAAEVLGIDAYDQAGGVMVEDFDGDGRLDIATSTMDTFGSMRFFKNMGDRGFVERTVGSGLDQQLGVLNMIGSDYDNDGDVDIYALRGAWMEDYGLIRNSLLRNEGNGRFADVTASAQLEKKPMPTQAAVWADFDNDGHLDLYVGNETRSRPEIRSSLFHNNGNGTFKDVAKAAGVTNDRFAKAVAAGDYDNDGDLDLYVSNRGVNRLYRNAGDGTFTDVAAAAGVTGPELSFVSWFFDYDNDGWLDLFVNGYAGDVSDVANDTLGLPHEGTTPALYRNAGDGTFTDVTHAAGLAHVYLAMGSNFGDLDSDGFLDIYIGTGKPSYETVVPNVMLRNIDGIRFENVSVNGGFDRMEKGHGIAFNDIDHDGDQDVYHQLGGMYPGDRSGNVLFMNPGTHEPRREGAVPQGVASRCANQSTGGRCAYRGGIGYTAGSAGRTPGGGNRERLRRLVVGPSGNRAR